MKQQTCPVTIGQAIEVSSGLLQPPTSGKKAGATVVSIVPHNVQYWELGIKLERGDVETILVRYDSAGKPVLKPNHAEPLS